MELLKILSAWMTIAYVRTYTITSETPLLPIQHILNDHAFLRLMPGHQPIVINCPEDTHLNRNTSTCDYEDVKLREEIGKIPIHHSVNYRFSKERLHNVLPAADCRKFILYGPSGWFEMTCPGTLFFNKNTHTCDQSSICCEFPENNSTRILEND